MNTTIPATKTAGTVCTFPGSPGGLYSDQFDIAAGGSSICPTGTVVSSEPPPTGMGTVSETIAGVGFGVGVGVGVGVGGDGRGGGGGGSGAGLSDQSHLIKSL